MIDRGRESGSPEMGTETMSQALRGSRRETFTMHASVIRLPGVPEDKLPAVVGV